MRVLVVDDEPGMRSYLVPLLERSGYAAHAVATGGEAVHSVQQRRPDLVLLDVGLPDIGGLEVCRELRRQDSRLPIILLTGLDSRQDELAGFAASADDYVTKPVHPDTLLARIGAVLRLAANTDGRQVRALGDMEVDLRARELRRDGRVVALSAGEFDLLAFLVEHPGQVFGKAQLLDQVWGPEFDGTTHAVEARMSRLRMAVELNPNRPQHLHNRRGMGYYLTLEPR